MVLILFLVTLSLGVATYSWYIVSTAPAIRAVETYMKVIDPVLAIARATDDKTPPNEVSNRDSVLDESGKASEEDKYFDITWGAVVESFGNDELKLDYPATIDTSDNCIKSPVIASDGRVGHLVELTEGKVGYDLDGEFGEYGVRYYIGPDGKSVCAMGLAVWLRINQENHDLIMSVANTTIKNAAGDTVVDNSNSKVAARVLTDGYSGDKFIPSTFNPETGTHTCVIYDKDDQYGTGPLPANTPILVEVVVYMEGEQEMDSASESQIGILAKHVNQGLYVNIESVTFYDNIDIVS